MTRLLRGELPDKTSVAESQLDTYWISPAQLLSRSVKLREQWAVHSRGVGVRDHPTEGFIRSISRLAFFQQ